MEQDGVVMATYQDALLLLRGPEQDCCPPWGPPQPSPVSSMLVSQTSPPVGAYNNMGRAVNRVFNHIRSLEAQHWLLMG